MEKPILLWDRSQCSEQVCTCHDDGITPRFCTGCGCNVASPGHRNTLDVIDRQAARIRELEGALRELLTVVHDEADDIDEDGGVCVYAFAADIEAARRILAEGSVKP